MRVRIRNLISRRRTRPTLWSGSRTTSRRPSAISRRGVSRCQVKYSISAAVLLPLNIISLPQSNHQPFSDKPSSRRIHICIIHQKLEKKRFPTFAPPSQKEKGRKKERNFRPSHYILNIFWRATALITLVRPWSQRRDSVSLYLFNINLIFHDLNITGTFIANSTAIQSLFRRILDQFTSMYR